MLPGQKYLPEDLLAILWLRKWLLILPTMLAAGGAAIYASKLPDKYQSETLILVVPQRVPESYVRSTVTARIEDRLNSIQQQILSRSRLERIIKDFNLYRQERQTMVMEDVVQRMRLDIQGPRIERGDAFRVGYVSSDPKMAQLVADRLASLFIEENLRDRAVLAEGTSQFLDAQLEDARQRLIEQDKKLEAYRRQYSGELPEQVDSNLRSIQGIQIQLQGNADAMNRDMDRRMALQKEIAALEEGKAVQPTNVPAQAAPGGGSTAQQLQSATDRLAQLELRYKPDHPDVGAAKRLIRDLRVRLQAEEEARLREGGSKVQVNPTEVYRSNRLRELQEELANIEAALQKRQINEERLRAAIDVLQGKVDSAPTRVSELTELTRNYGTLNNTYLSLLSKREDSKIAENLERRQVGEQFKVLDPARLPERPFSPKRTRLTGLASAGGLALGLVLIGLLEYRDRSFKTEEDVMRVLQIPVLALVPHMRSETELRRRRHQRLVTAAATVLFVGSLAGAYAAWKLHVF
jgi:polysaccharide chain length determinant protein (PEP-CTERM system associated)